MNSTILRHKNGIEGAVALVENGLLGSILVNPEALLLVHPTLRPADFEDPDKGFLFGVMSGLKGKWDEIILLHELDRLRPLTPWAPVLGNLIDHGSYEDDIVKRYAEIIRAEATRRRIEERTKAK